MKKYRGIIFDLDGTLLDTIEDLGDSMNKVLEEFDFPTFTYAEYKLKIGGGIKNLVINSFPISSSQEIIDEGLKKFNSYYNENYRDKTEPYKGIMELLYQLKDREIKLGVNSNKRNDYTHKLVEKYFSDIPFLAIYGEREDVVKKPDPTGALEIAEIMDLKAEEILYIGDSKVDILTAKNASMDSVGVLWGFRDREEFNKYGANFIVRDPKEILEMV